jgi:hypothetical protein
VCKPRTGRNCSLPVWAIVSFKETSSIYSFDFALQFPGIYLAPESGFPMLVNHIRNSFLYL